MEEILRGHLKALALAYSSATGISLRAIGSRAMNYSYFFERVDNDKVSLTLRTYDKVVNWFSANWPDGIEWPAGVQRPFIEERAA